MCNRHTRSICKKTQTCPNTYNEQAIDERGTKTVKVLLEFGGLNPSQWLETNSLSRLMNR